ncbi:MAG: hypothetical protein Q7R56_01455 [Nanoarchaeota archaeon]|nr:hypothetical protein [Nanoarchaeota archaeon]
MQRKPFYFIIILSLLLIIAAYGPSKSAPETTNSKTSEQTNLPLTKDCNDYETQRERIQCRINLPENKAFNYLPEECRGKKGIDGEQCVQTYKRLQKCFNNNNYAVQHACAKQELETTLPVQDALTACNKETNKKICQLQLAEKTYTLIKFRIYSYEYYIQELYQQQRISETLAIDSISKLETIKQQFNQATTITIKKQVLATLQPIIQEIRNHQQP